LDAFEIHVILPNLNKHMLRLQACIDCIKFLSY
jgi:hypothetical protein